MGTTHPLRFPCIDATDDRGRSRGRSSTVCAGLCSGLGGSSSGDAQLQATRRGNLFLPKRMRSRVLPPGPVHRPRDLPHHPVGQGADGCSLHRQVFRHDARLRMGDLRFYGLPCRQPAVGEEDASRVSNLPVLLRYQLVNIVQVTLATVLSRVPPLGVTAHSRGLYEIKWRISCTTCG